MAASCVDIRSGHLMQVAGGRKRAGSDVGSVAIRKTWLAAAIGIVLYIGSRMFAPAEEMDLAQTFGTEWEGLQQVCHAAVALSEVLGGRRRQGQGTQPRPPTPHQHHCIHIRSHHHGPHRSMVKPTRLTSMLAENPTSMTAVVWDAPGYPGDCCRRPAWPCRAFLGESPVGATAMAAVSRPVQEAVGAATTTAQREWTQLPVQFLEFRRNGLQARGAPG